MPSLLDIFFNKIFPAKQIILLEKSLLLFPHNSLSSVDHLQLILLALHSLQANGISLPHFICDEQFYDKELQVSLLAGRYESLLPLLYPAIRFSG